MKLIRIFRLDPAMMDYSLSQTSMDDPLSSFSTNESSQVKTPVAAAVYKKLKNEYESVSYRIILKKIFKAMNVMFY